MNWCSNAANGQISGHVSLQTIVLQLWLIWAYTSRENGFKNKNSNQ